MNAIEQAYKTMVEDSLIFESSIHPEIQAIMDSDNSPKNKLNLVTAHVRRLIKSNIDTGLESDKPKKGSSRAVFFPKERKQLNVDGIDTHTPTAVKIAFPGSLDKHHGEPTLLGEDQNNVEGNDHFINRNYGILHEDGNSGKYKSCSHESGGVLAPVIHSHEDGHHIEVGRCEKVSAKSIADATKTKEFPKGLKHSEIYDALVHEHESAHGALPPIHKSYEEHLEKVKTHPWVEHTIDMMHNSEMNPKDLGTRNLGIYTHPVTGKKHLAIIDWGFNRHIAAKYTRARRNARMEL